MPVPGESLRAKKKASRPKAAITSQFDHNSQLLEAISQGKPLRVVRRLIESKADTNYQGGEHLASPLMLACEITEEDNREAILNLLLLKGADVNLQDSSGKTALMRAVWADVNTVGTLLKHGAKVDLADSDGNIALSHAAERGDVECVSILVQAGKKKRVNIDHQNLRSLTPLLLAAQEGHLEVAKVLVEGGASLSKRDLDHFMNAQEWMKLQGFFPDHELEFLSPSGKKKDFYRQERMRRGIKTLSDYLPTARKDGRSSPNVFTMQNQDTSTIKRQFPALHTTSSDSDIPSKSMFDLPLSKKQPSPAAASGHDKQRRSSISFPSVASVKTDLYKSSYLSKRNSLLHKNSQSDGYHSGALVPIPGAQQLTNPPSRVTSKNTSRLPPINK